MEKREVGPYSTQPKSTLILVLPEGLIAHLQRISAQFLSLPGLQRLRRPSRVAQWITVYRICISGRYNTTSAKRLWHKRVQGMGQGHCQFRLRRFNGPFAGKCTVMVPKLLVSLPLLDKTHAELTARLGSNFAGRMHHLLPCDMCSDMHLPGNGRSF